MNAVMFGLLAVSHWKWPLVDLWTLVLNRCGLSDCGEIGYVLQAAQSSGTLFQIKQSPQVLEETLEKVGQASDLFRTLRWNLTRTVV